MPPWARRARTCARVESIDGVLFAHEHPELGAAEPDDGGATFATRRRHLLEIRHARPRDDAPRQFLEDDGLESFSLLGVGFIDVTPSSRKSIGVEITFYQVLRSEQGQRCPLSRDSLATASRTSTTGMVTASCTCGEVLVHRVGADTEHGRASAFQTSAPRRRGSPRSPSSYPLVGAARWHRNRPSRSAISAATTHFAPT